MTSVEPDKNHPMLRRGAIHLTAHWLELLATHRPAHPLTFMCAQLHRTRGGMRLSKVQLHEFVTRSPDATPQLLLSTLLLSLPEAVTDLADTVWRDICLCSADILVASFKSIEDLPTTESLSRKFGFVPFLLSLIVSMAASKMELALLCEKRKSLSVNVCLQMGSANTSDAEAAQLAETLRSRNDAASGGVGLLGVVTDDLRWLARGCKEPFSWHVTVIDCTPRSVVAAVARHCIAATVAPFSRESVTALAATDFPSAMATLHENSGKKQWDFVVLMQRPRLSHYISQLGALLAPVVTLSPTSATSAATLPLGGFVDLSRVSVASTAADASFQYPPSWPMFACLLQAITGADMPTLPPFLPSSVVVLRGDFCSAMDGRAAYSRPATDDGGPPSTLRTGLDLFLRGLAFARASQEPSHTPNPPQLISPFVAIPSDRTRLCILFPDELPTASMFARAAKFLAAAAPVATAPPMQAESAATHTAEVNGAAEGNVLWSTVLGEMTTAQWLGLAVHDRMAWEAHRAVERAGCAGSGGFSKVLAGMPVRGVLSFSRLDPAAPTPPAPDATGADLPPPPPPPMPSSPVEEASASGPDTLRVSEGVETVVERLSPEYVYGCPAWCIARASQLAEKEKVAAAALTEAENGGGGGGGVTSGAASAASGSAAGAVGVPTKRKGPK